MKFITYGDSGADYASGLEWTRGESRSSYTCHNCDRTWKSDTMRQPEDLCEHFRAAGILF